jgi:hypothetical protein
MKVPNDEMGNIRVKILKKLLHPLFKVRVRYGGQNREVYEMHGRKFYQEKNKKTATYLRVYVDKQGE